MITVSGAVAWSIDPSMGNPDMPRGAAATVMGLCYAPLLRWGPLLAAVTVHHHRRRS
ncbi:hypothetical protein [Crossiella sp. NPDC003009]